MSAILVQTLGSDAVLKSATRYKTGREILDDFRHLLRNPVPRASFLTVGVADPPGHRQSLLAMTNGFAVLVAERAGGLHAGVGPSRDVAVVAARKVSDFLAALARSNRIRSYLEGYPVPPEDSRGVNVLVDDLVGRLKAAKKVDAQATLLRSVFLVLPEMPEIAPDWIGAFDRVTVTPAREDISLLLTTLEKAAPVRFLRVSAAGNAVPVVVRPDDPEAIPIAPHHLRRSFVQIADQFAADVGNANGRLDAGTLDLPPDDFVLDLFVLAPQDLRRSLQRESLSAHELWPFVAASLMRQGTAGPHWFLVRMSEDLGQLESQLGRAFRLSKTASAAQRYVELQDGLRAIRDGRPLAKTSALLRHTLGSLDSATAARQRLATAAQRNREGVRAVSQTTSQLVARAANEEVSVGEAIDQVVATATNAKARQYWTRVMAEAASDPSDRQALVGLVHASTLPQSHTAARKALRLIDALTYGPAMEIEGA